MAIGTKTRGRIGHPNLLKQSERSASASERRDSTTVLQETSVICLPTRRTGLIAPAGSWATKPIRLPRT